MALETGCGTKVVARERSGHTAVISENRLFVWGGYVSVGDHEVFLPNDEIWVYDLENGLCIPADTVPLGQSWHTLTAVSDTSLFLFGGLSLDCRPMSDGWIFNLKMKRWTEMKHSNMDKPRLWHSACLGRNSDVVVFGGSHDYILLKESVM